MDVALGPSRRANLPAGRDYRLFVIAAICIYFGVVLYATSVDSASWRYLGVPTLETEPFLDLRGVTSAWECDRAGYDVRPENPCDPIGRNFNYPRVWLSLTSLGLGQASTVPLGVAIGAVFLFSALVLAGRLDRLGAAVWTAVILSPSVMLAVERGNVDTIMFVLVVAGLFAFSSGNRLAHVGSYGLFGLAAALKLFPVFACAVLLRQERRRVLMVGAFGAVLVLSAVALGDLQTIEYAAPKVVTSTYGAGVTVALPGVGLRAVPPELKTGWIAVGLGLALAFLLARRMARVPTDQDAASTRRLDAFWAGAAIYVGTFAFGSNYDYRLIFLMLTLPQLLAWSRSRSPASSLSRGGLGGIVLLVWLSATPVFLGQVLTAPAIGRVARPLSEFWATTYSPDDLLALWVFVALAALLVATRPSWLRAQARRPAAS